VADPLAALRRPGGAFAMVALDQRESLRTMLGSASEAPADRAVPDEEMTAFKVEAARALTPFASAVLLDSPLGLGPARDAGAIAPGCGLIVAADRLVQKPGGPVEWTKVDEAVFEDDTIARIADAWKLLVVWRRGEEAERARLVRAFVEACRRSGRPAIVEGIVRMPDGAPWDAAAHADLIVEASREIAPLGADLYKAEVPTLGAGDDGAIRAAAGRVTEAVDRPWVVLSNGTPRERFPAACIAAVEGGASGFLAGRAIWSASLAAPDRSRHLRDVAARGLATLAEAVDGALAARSSI
jgi:sulfofructosephosphate aldolase